jgi:hypothetical protein
MQRTWPSKLLELELLNRQLASAARLRGYEEDLGMTGNQFNTLTSILYVGYLLTQAPSYVPALDTSATYLIIEKQHGLTPHEKAITIPLELHGNMGCSHHVDGYVQRSLDWHWLTRGRERCSTNVGV